ncbi:hypothetical protein QLX08_001870 [Tetragonisca angustula]|uniref:Uncharacterized protein n=1 Tax=Tetragonisca angustula TaxID=166442 RepID=A0AAW1ADL1_9HYME
MASRQEKNEVGYCARKLGSVSRDRWAHDPPEARKVRREQLIRRISYQGDEVSLTAKKNGGRKARRGTPRACRLENS